MKRLFFGFLFLLVSAVHAATKTAVIMYDNNLQSGTTGFHVSSGTVRNLTASTATIRNLTANNLTVTTFTATSLSISSFTTTNLQTTNLRVTTETWKGFGILPIIQIQQYTTNTSSSISNTTFERTTLNGTITPKISSSKILVFAAGNVSCTGVGVCYATVYRDTTQLASSDGGFETNGASSNNFSTMIYYDSPGSTSAVEYAVRLRVNGGGVTAAFPGTDGGIYTTTAVLILAEIAQ